MSAVKVNQQALHLWFAEPLHLKSILIGVFSYLLATVFLSAVLVGVWQPAGETDFVALAEAAETAPMLIWGGAAIGAMVAFLVGALTVRLSYYEGLKNTAVVGLILVIYGAISVVMHPNDPLIFQIGKIILPIPIVLLGGLLFLRKDDLFPNVN